MMWLADGVLACLATFLCLVEAALKRDDWGQ